MLTGKWILKRWQFRTAEGVKPAFGENPRGHLIYGENGELAVLITSVGHEPFAYSGRWSFEGSGYRQVVHEVEIASRSDFEDSSFSHDVSLDEGQLTLSSSPTEWDGEEGRHELCWQRAQSADTTVLVRDAEALYDDCGDARLSWYATDVIGGMQGLTLGRCRLDPGAGNPLHFHPNCDEVLHVSTGRIRHSYTTPDGELKHFEMDAGDTIHVPRGVIHNAQNIGDSEADLIIAFSSKWRGFSLAPAT